MRITVLLMVLALLCGTAVAQDEKIPEEKAWGYDLTGMRNVPEVEPNDTCPGQIIVCGDVVDGNLSTGTDMDWYQFEVTVPNTVVTIGTDAGPEPDATDTKLYLFGACVTAYLAYNDDGGPGYYSLITYTVATPGWYNIEVIPYSASYSGNYIMFLTCQIPEPPPVNDTCAGAIAIERCTSGVIEGDLTWANNDYTPGVYPSSCTGYGALGKDVVYVVDLLAGDVIDLVYSYVGTSFDESLYIITDCADPAGTCVAGADAGHPEDIIWTCTADGTYYIICDNYSASGGGPFTLTYNVICPPVAVCCVGEVCYLYTEADCAAAGGIWFADLTSCEPNPCLPPPPVAVCCVGEVCYLYNEVDCGLAGGIGIPT